VSLSIGSMLHNYQSLSMAGFVSCWTCYFTCYSTCYTGEENLSLYFEAIMIIVVMCCRNHGDLMFTSQYAAQTPMELRFAMKASTSHQLHSYSLKNGGPVLSYNKLHHPLKHFQIRDAQNCACHRRSSCCRVASQQMTTKGTLVHSSRC
jgi:hypothetical protein